MKLAVKAIIDTVGPEGRCPTLLVFGTLPRPPRTQPAATQLERAKAKESANIEIQKELAKRKLSFAMKHTHSPKGKEASAKLHSLPAGAPVLVWRETSESWEGPLPFINIDGETVVFQLPHGRKIFRSTVMKPTTGSLFKEINSAYYTTDEISDKEQIVFFGTTKIRIAKKNESEKFKEARKSEIQGLLEKNFQSREKKHSSNWNKNLRHKIFRCIQNSRR